MNIYRYTYYCVILKFSETYKLKNVTHYDGVNEFKLIKWKKYSAVNLL